MKKILMTGLIAGGLFAGLQTSATAQGTEDAMATGDPVKCVDVVRIRNSKIIDNQTIILNMSGGPDIQMKLANRCPGLKMQGTWLHDAKGQSKLCDVDVIKVPVTSTGNILNTSYTSCIIESLTKVAADTPAADTKVQ